MGWTTTKGEGNGGIVGWIHPSNHHNEDKWSWDFCSFIGWRIDRYRYDQLSHQEKGRQEGGIEELNASVCKVRHGLDMVMGPRFGAPYRIEGVCARAEEEGEDEGR